MKITVVGGGNIGTQFAVHCAEKGHDVTVFTSSPALFRTRLSIVDDHGRTTHEGSIHCATDDPGKAFRDADLVLVTLPSNMMKAAADMIFEHTNAGTVIGVVPGSGGSECAFGQCIRRGNTFFGIERVPAIARLVKKGETVKSFNYRKELHVAAIPGSRAEQCARIVSGIFDMPCAVIPCYLNLTMTPSNPILHTTRLRTIFSDWHDGITYDTVPLFYEEWDNPSSELLFACDEEVQKICRALPRFRLQYVRSLKLHYESPTVEAMTEKIRSIAAFRGLPTPAVKVDGGYIPDLHSRYFTADFSFGLTLFRQIADFAGVSTPNIDETMAWYKAIAAEKDEFCYRDYGITNISSFEQFYLR